MEYKGILENINGKENSQLLIINGLIKSQYNLLSYMSSGKILYNKEDEFLIYTNIDKFQFRYNEYIYNLNIKNSTLIDIEPEQTTFNKVLHSYKNLKISNISYNINKNIDTIKVHIYRIKVNYELLIKGDIKGKVIYINKISYT